MTVRTLVPVAAVLCALAGPAQAAVPPAAPVAPERVAQQQADALRAELADLRAQATRSVQAYEQAEEALGEAVVRATTLDERLERARQVADVSGARVASRVAAVYRSGGRAGLLSSLVGARDAADLASRVANANAVVGVDALAREKAAADRDALVRVEARAQAAADERVRQADRMRVHSGAVAAALARQERAVQQADETVRRLVEQARQAARARAARELAARLRAEQERARIQAEVQARATAQAQAAAQAQARATAPAPAAAGGTPPGPDEAFAAYGATAAAGTPASGPGAQGLLGAYAGPPATCPVGPSASFTDTWHAPRSGGRRHQGTDVFAPEGSPAYAVVDGVIDKTGDGGLGGITLWLRADNGDRFYYAHNSANAVTVGQRVRAGQVVAYVGRTGNAAATPAHVHFEAHPQGGAAANPYPWLAAICAL